MKKLFNTPEMVISMFDMENVVTEPSGPVVPTTTDLQEATKNAAGRAANDGGTVVTITF